jgi:hypothetical protein
MIAINTRTAPAARLTRKERNMLPALTERQERIVEAFLQGLGKPGAGFAAGFAAVIEVYTDARELEVGAALRLSSRHDLEAARALEMVADKKWSNRPPQAVRRSIALPSIPDHQTETGGLQRVTANQQGCLWLTIEEPVTLESLSRTHPHLVSQAEEAFARWPGSFSFSGPPSDDDAAAGL